MRKILGVFRLIMVLFSFTAAGVDFFFRLWLTGRAKSIPTRAKWMSFWASVYFKQLGGKVTYDGTPPASGVLASNHLSYIDILTYGSIRPMVFVSKSEVRDWPIIGKLTQFAGTLYIRRQVRGDVLPLAEQMAAVAKEGPLITLFLEGTSTGGDQVLPFRSSLMAPVEEQGLPVTPAWIHYSMKNGSVSDEVCYWRDMTLGPHLFNLLCKDGFEAHVSFGKTITEKMDRKAISKELHTRVCEMREQYLSKK